MRTVAAVISLIICNFIVDGREYLDPDDQVDIDYSITRVADGDTAYRRVLSSIVVTEHSYKPVVEASTTLNREDVDRLDIISMKQVSEISPNFYIPDYGSRMTSSIYMRGIGARIDQPAVGLMVDGVAMLNKDNYDFDLADISRLTVTRGPQSSLYGRNTMAGMITVNTLSPMEFTGVRASLEGGSGGLVRANAGVYVRPAYDWGTSLSVDFSRIGGFFTNVYTGKKADAEESGSARWKIEYRGADNLSVTNTASLGLSRQHGYPYSSIETGMINYNDTCYYRRTGFTDGLSVSLKKSRVTYISKTSVQHINDDMTLDQDFTSDSYFTLTQKRNEWAVTQDLTASGAAGGDRYEWLGGVFGFYKGSDMSAPVTFKETGIRRLIVDHRNPVNPDYPIEWNEDQFVLGSDFTNRVWGLAAYHRSTLKLDRWTAEAMLRLDYEHTGLSYLSHCKTSYTTLDATSPSRPPVPYMIHEIDLDDNGRLSKSSLQLLPRLSVNYRPPCDVLEQLYITVAKGYKAGGYNTQMFSDVLQQSLMEKMGLSPKYDVNDIVAYKPEKSWNFEIGGNFMYRRVRGAFAMFYIDCRDQQLTMFPDGTTTGRIMTNAGHTRSLGVELQAHYTVNTDLSLNGSWGYTDARFVKFNDGLGNYDGKRVPYAPQHTLFLDANYTLRMRRLSWLRKIVFDINARGVGDIYWDEDNARRQKFYMLGAASVSFQRQDCSVDIWVENFTDTRFATFQYKSMGNIFYQEGKPRRFGVTLRATIGTGDSRRRVVVIQ